MCDGRVYRKLKFVLIFLCCISPLGSLEKPFVPPLTAIPAESLRSPLITPITLEHAQRNHEIAWGLMQRSELPDNHGMTFNFKSSEKRSFWSFNCLIPLSIAFLDERKIIREISSLKAFPEMMDPNRPVNNYRDLKLYPPGDPIISFFSIHSTSPTAPFQYALEMNKGWFSKHQVKVGDIAFWKLSSSFGQIIHSIPIEKVKEFGFPASIEYPTSMKAAVFPGSSNENWTIQYFDENQQILQEDLLRSSNHHPSPSFCLQAVKKILIFLNSEL